MAAALNSTAGPALAALGNRDGQVALWDTRHDSLDHVWEPPHKRSGWVRSVALGPQGDVAAVWEDGSLALFPLGKTQPRVAHIEDKATALTFLPDGRLIVGFLNGTIRLWDWHHDMWTAPIPAHHAAVTGFVLSKDAAQLLSTGDDGTVMLWRVRDFTALP